MNFLFMALDDPYYCGLQARVPNFVKTKTKDVRADVREISGPPTATSKRLSMAQQPMGMAHHSAAVQVHSSALGHAHLQHQQQMMWHARSFENGIGVYNKLKLLMSSRHQNFHLNQPQRRGHTHRP